MAVQNTGSTIDRHWRGKRIMNIEERICKTFLIGHLNAKIQVNPDNKSTENLASHIESVAKLTGEGLFCMKPVQKRVEAVVIFQRYSDHSAKYRHINDGTWHNQRNKINL